MFLSKSKLSIYKLNVLSIADSMWECSIDENTYSNTEGTSYRIHQSKGIISPPSPFTQFVVDCRSLHLNHLLFSIQENLSILVGLVIIFFVFHGYIVVPMESFLVLPLIFILDYYFPILSLCHTLLFQTGRSTVVYKSVDKLLTMLVIVVVMCTTKKGEGKDTHLTLISTF